MRSQPEAKGAFASSAPEDTVVPQREGPGHVSQKEDTVQSDLQNEATVLGVSPPYYKENPEERLRM